MKALSRNQPLNNQPKKLLMTKRQVRSTRKESDMKNQKQFNPYRRLFPTMIFAASASLMFTSPARAQCVQGCDSNTSTFLGYGVLTNNSGSNDTGVGFSAISWNTTGNNNTAVGS